MKFKKKNVLGISLGTVIILASIVLVIAFSEKSNPEDKKEENINAVLKQLFTCPGEEMIKLYDDMINTEKERCLSSVTVQA